MRRAGLHTDCLCLVDFYRNKTRQAILGEQKEKDMSKTPHMEIRPGKKLWEDFKKNPRQHEVHSP